MAASALGPWEPLSLEETVAIFRAATFPWWISGGRTLELHLGRSWRDHEDTDVGIVRADVPQLSDVLWGWDIHVAAAGRLSPWSGDALRPELHQNNLWCRRAPNMAWSLDVTVGEGDTSFWVFRRDPSVRVAWGDAVLETSDHVRYLAPELQLLFKSRDLRDKDEVDAREVIPDLEPERRDRLAELLPREHPWHRLLGAA